MNKVKELESIPTKIEYKGIVWVPEEKITKKKNTKRIYSQKQPYIKKWVNTLKVGSVFTVDEFWNNHPNHTKDKKGKIIIDRSISELIKDEKILQLNKDEFKVLK